MGGPSLGDAVREGQILRVVVLSRVTVKAEMLWAMGFGVPETL